MKFPLDPTTYVETINQVVEHEKTQNLLIQKMGELLEEAMDSSESDDESWYRESEGLLKDIHGLKMYHESRRFNETNLQAQQPKEKTGSFFNNLGDVDYSNSMVDGEMSEDELAKHFKEKRKDKKQKEKPKSLSQMSLDEIESWEKQQENSNDIYKIKARVANLARGGGASLTPQGEMLVNTFVHVIKALYDFSEKLEDKNVKIQLDQLIRSQEGMPASLIAAAGVGVRTKKDEKVKRS